MSESGGCMTELSVNLPQHQLSTRSVCQLHKISPQITVEFLAWVVTYQERNVYILATHWRFCASTKGTSGNTIKFAVNFYKCAQSSLSRCPVATVAGYKLNPSVFVISSMTESASYLHIAFVNEHSLAKNLHLSIYIVGEKL